MQCVHCDLCRLIYMIKHNLSCVSFLHFSQLNKTVLEGWSTNNPAYENATLLKEWCKTKKVLALEEVTFQTNVTDLVEGQNITQLTNVTELKNVTHTIGIQQCKYDNSRFFFYLSFLLPLTGN